MTVFFVDQFGERYPHLLYIAACIYNRETPAYRWLYLYSRCESSMRSEGWGERHRIS
jgi:hypothetical protein